MTIPRQLPNAITIVRILCAPVFLWMLLADGGADGPVRWWAAVLFIVAIATDGIDGHLARKHHIVTDLGKLLDPIADKVLTVRAESSTWATSLRQIAPQLVARLNEQLGQGSVERVQVIGPHAPSWKKGRRSVPGRGPRDTYG